MLAKAREQAGGNRPMIGLRWYRNERLEVAADWVAVRAQDMAEVLQEANILADLEKDLIDVYNTRGTQQISVVSLVEAIRKARE